jgi:hypothetical protein
LSNEGRLNGFFRVDCICQTHIAVEKTYINNEYSNSS